MNQAAAAVRERSRLQQGPRISSTNCPVVTVTFDGTWQKRGHSSRTGIGTAIVFDTGLILDTQVMSNL